VTPYFRKLSWFGGLYLGSIAALALLTFILEEVLWLVVR
jgi:hypothetical protein